MIFVDVVGLLILCGLLIEESERVNGRRGTIGLTGDRRR